MTREVIFRPAAEAELSEAFAWYEKQESGLGLEFMRCIEASVVSIQRSPELYPAVHKSVRRAVVRRFPYCIFYVSAEDAVTVLAVFHAARNPMKWKRRR